MYNHDTCHILLNNISNLRIMSKYNIVSMLLINLGSHQDICKIQQ
jgi:hypothetical protein